MQIQNFKTFCDLVETKSFSKAARLNGVTQSAVSQQLKAMEIHYDMLIIDRNQKKFRLTPQGAIREMLHHGQMLYHFQGNPTVV